MGLREDRIRKSEENRKHTELKNSLIWAMYDSGYDISDIAERLNTSKLSVKIHLGQVEIRTNSI